MLKRFAGTAAVASARTERQGDAPTLLTSRQVHFVLIASAAFVLYWFSSLVVAARDGTTHFAADTWFYAELAQGEVFSRVADNYHLDRILRFHPTTVVLAAGWMKVVAPLTPLVAPPHLLKAMFAFVGAVGVWAALWAFAAIVPRRHVMLLGAIYASSLSVWYFSSLEESKIVSATLVALYIATYLHLRERWTTRGAVLLTVILLLACLNETIAVFLVAIPAVDTLVQRGWDLRHGCWIACHALAGPVAFAVLEGIMRGRSGPAGTDPEGANHFSMLVYYISQSQHTAASLYEFVIRWLFFSVAAPSPTARYDADASVHYGGDFEPLLANYLSSPVSAALVVLFCAMLVVSVLPRYREKGATACMPGVLLALAAYALLRGAFFLVFIPHECILFSASVVLAHLLLITIPFAASSFPWKQHVLAGFAALLFITNLTFIVGR
ncbi:MAG TPA: hypothetical protein VG758_30530 [Hyphomicrobiaceae bacterium]|jgi:hypothetical protein|nr:hypothetical protein [Hyphomicrobiaceae bacterium]